MGGQFTVHRSANNAFAQVPVDQTIEQTMNWDSKTVGDIVGISINRGAVRRCILTTHDRAMIQICGEVAGLYDVASKHRKDATAHTHMKKGENDVHTFMQTIILRAGKSFQIKERH